MKTKECSRCGKIIPINKFSKRTANKDGLVDWCKACVSAYDKEYRGKHIEKRKKYGIKYRKENAKKIAKHAREFSKKNAKKIAKYQKAYYKRNRKKIKKQIGEYINKRMKNDPVFKLNRGVSLRIRQSLKQNKDGTHWENLTGYTLEDLKKHLELTMPENYTWNDYLKGRLHLDHKIPISIFNITSTKCKGFKKCWALENLQLLPASENIRKGNKLFHP